MTTSSFMTATLFTVLAVAHSAAGETGFIRPLINAEWTIDEVPRWAADRLLRTAWHLTSVAWLAMAVVAAGGTPVAAISVAAVASSVMMFIGLRGHPAWPLFLLAGLFGFAGEGWLTTPVLLAATAATAVALTMAAALHIYWAAGGSLLADAAVPTDQTGETTFSPGPLVTLAVAGLLIAFTVMISITALTDEPWPLRWLVLAGVAVLGARAVGDGRHAGFTKKHRESTFGEYDDRYFTPLVVFLAIGATASILA